MQGLLLEPKLLGWRTSVGVTVREIVREASVFVKAQIPCPKSDSPGMACAF